MARKIEIEVTGDTRNLERALKSSQKSASDFERGMKKASKGALIGLAALGVGAAASLKWTIEFDKSMRNVNSIAKLSEEQFKDLSQSVLDLAGETGQAPAVLADGLYGIVSSGFEANEAVKVLAASAKAASAGLTDTATASTAIAAALNAYHLEANQARKVSDVLFETVNKGVLSFEELAQNMGDMVPVAAPLGVKLEEVGAAIATITLQGVPAAEAATRVKNVMIQLAKPSENLAKLLKQQGFASGEAAVKQLGFVGVLKLLDKATKGNVTRTAALTPEIRALMGTVGLTGANLKTYTSNLDAMKHSTDGAGATSEAFAEQGKSVSMQWNKAKADIQATAIEIGMGLLPAVMGAIGGLDDLVDVVEENETAAKALTIGVASLAGGVVLLNTSLSIYNSAALKAVTATKALRLAVAATPWGLAAVAAASLVSFIISQGDEAEDTTEQQRRLTDAVRDYQSAIKAGNDARDEYAASSRRVESAEIAVQRAIINRKQVDKDATSSTLDRREADLQVAAAQAELRDATDEATAAGTRFRDEQLRGIGAKERSRVAVERLAKEFRDNLVQAQDVYKKGAGETRVVTGRVSEATARGRANAEAYADKLRALAATMDNSQKSLRDTARLAALLADAWGRVVSLPAAREFVAKFTVISRVEETRTIPTGRAAGGAVQAGAPYIVGEYRPEIFIPSTSGRIVPRVPQTAGATAGARGRYVIMGDGEFVSWLRSVDAGERRRNGGKGIL